MTIGTHLESFFDKPVVDYQFRSKSQTNPANTYRLSVEYDSPYSLVDVLEDFIKQSDTSQITSLVFGAWTAPYEQNCQDVLNLLIEYRTTFSALKAVFFGDITYEECEASWIIQNDFDNFLKTYDQLEVFAVRGSAQLTISAFEHQNLHTIIIQSGGLSAEVIGNLADSKLPNLQHLELWLGIDEYGLDADLNFIKTAILKMQPERLRYLGLVNSEMQDELAQWLASESWIAKLDTLDLSKGTLSDIGGQALLASPYLSQLKHLDLHHHYMSPTLCNMFASIGDTIDISEQQTDEAYDDEVYRYVALSE